ncbi:hypothetical protein MVEN_00606100 [Mycena venus]|uniref:Uncharacterized protein n=1 Tax=Mycena venus TaxID=2733690 RepID=A0A8H7D526_9AGAR|nr:hypothetical protein MVEN_00606100 [Mycena venus]
MTEYDYSPAAVERYHQKLADIGQWRDTTAQIRQKDPHAPPTPAYPPADLPRSKSTRRRTRSSDRDDYRDDYSDNRGRDDSSSKHHRRRSTRDPPPPLPPPLDRSRSVGPRPRTAPPRGDIYGLQQPPPPASQFYPGPAPVQPYYPAPAGPGYMSAPPYPQQTQHTRSRSTSHAPAPAPPPAPHPTRTRSYSFAPPAAAGPAAAPRELVPVHPAAAAAERQGLRVPPRAGPSVPPAWVRECAGGPAAARVCERAAARAGAREPRAVQPARAHAEPDEGGAVAEKGFWIWKREEFEPE